MNARFDNTDSDWQDPDDAPELTGDEIDRQDAVWRVGGAVVAEDQGKAAFRSELCSQMLLDALDADVADWVRRKASAHDYPSFINSALREWMRRQNDAAERNAASSAPKA